METTKDIYKEGSIPDSIPFIGCFSGLDGAYNHLKEIYVDDSIMKALSTIPKEKPRKTVIIGGRSAPEEISLYNEALGLIKYKWVENGDYLELIFCLKYFNSGTARAITQIVKELAKKFENRFHVLWLADATDEDAIGAGFDIRGFTNQNEKTFSVQEVIELPKTK